MTRERATAALVALLFGPLALGACTWIGGIKQSDLTCPAVVPAPGADTIAMFSPAGHASKDVVVGGRIFDLSAKCEREKVGLAVNAEIVFMAQRATTEIKDATLPYFVALVDLAAACPDRGIVPDRRPVRRRRGRAPHAGREDHGACCRSKTRAWATPIP